MATPASFDNPYPSAQGPLATALVTLAGTPEYVSTVDPQLREIAELAAARVDAATYASITRLRGPLYITVAVSDEIARAIDDAQYADDTGPCLEALRTGRPVGVPDIAATTMRWPGFHEEAPRLGLHASVSVPLHTARGGPVAVLNLYGRDQAAMAPLIAEICSLQGYPLEEAAGPGRPALTDEGGRELVAGYAEALAVRARITLALTVIMTESRCTSDDAYVSLCIRAAQAGTGLDEAAVAVIPPEPA
jgi:hypothetical protein